MTDITKPKNALSHLVDEVKTISKHTKSDATKKAYQSDFRQFSKWCDEVNLASMPADPETVALYLAHLNSIKRKVSTINRALTGIAQAHILSGHPLPIDPRVNELKKGIRRIRGTAKDKKKPITLEILRRIIAHIPRDYIGYRDMAILLVGWTGALRRSEIVALDVEDIDEQEEGICLTIRKSKTDQEGSGRKIGLPFFDSEKDLCAARALRKWITVSRIEEGAIFRRVGKIGRNDHMCLSGFTHYGGRLGERRISMLIKESAIDAGYDGKLYSGHSLRSGLATTLAQSGIEERRIMGITGHQSLKILREYITDGSLFRDHPVMSLFSDSEE